MTSTPRLIQTSTVRAKVLPRSRKNVVSSTT